MGLRLPPPRQRVARVPGGHPAQSGPPGREVTEETGLRERRSTVRLPQVSSNLASVTYELSALGKRLRVSPVALVPENHAQDILQVELDSPYCPPVPTPL